MAQRLPTYQPEAPGEQGLCPQGSLPCIHLFCHSLAHSLTRSLTPSLTRSLTHSLAHSFTTHSLTVSQREGHHQQAEVSGSQRASMSAQSEDALRGRVTSMCPTRVRRNEASPIRSIINQYGAALQPARSL
jgi:hypothetical protein